MAKVVVYRTIGGVPTDSVMLHLKQENQQATLLVTIFRVIRTVISCSNKKPRKQRLLLYRSMRLYLILSHHLQEVSTKMLSSDYPGQINSASTAGAIRTKLWRQRQVLNPRPKIPSGFNEYMSTEMPASYTNTADGKRFMIKKDWVDPTSPIVVFMSEWSTDLMRLHKIWLFDGTFKTAPPLIFCLLFLCKIH